MRHDNTHCAEMPTTRSADVSESNPRGEWLRGIPMFRDLTGVELNRLAALLTSKSKEKGDYLFHTGAKAEELFIVRSGKVKLSLYDRDGREVIREILRPGQLAMEQALIGAYRSQTNGITMTGVCLYTLPLPDLRAMMEDSQRFALAVYRQVSTTAIRQSSRMESLILSDARTRLLNLIAELVETEGRVLADGSVLIHHGLTHQDIGGLTAISRQTVTTLLNELRADRVINFDRQSILVHEPANLRK